MITPVAESTFVSRVVCVLLSVVVFVELVVGHPRPSLSGTGVPWVCPCRDPPVCHRVQGDSVAKRQSFFVRLLVLLECDIMCSLHSRSTCRDVLTTGCSSCATENTYTPARLEALFKALSRHRSQCGLWVLFPTRHLVEDLIDIFLVYCLQCRNPSCSRKCKSICFSVD